MRVEPPPGNFQKLEGIYFGPQIKGDGRDGSFDRLDVVRVQSRRREAVVELEIAPTWFGVAIFVAFGRYNRRVDS